MQAALFLNRACSWKSRGANRRGGWKDESALNWIAQLLLAGVFLFDGFRRVFSFRRKAKPLVAGSGFDSRSESIQLTAVIAMTEIAGALAVTDSGGPLAAGRFAADCRFAGLALLAVGASIRHAPARVRRANRDAVSAGPFCDCGAVAAVALRPRSVTV